MIGKDRAQTLCLGGGDRLLAQRTKTSIGISLNSVKVLLLESPLLWSTKRSNAAGGAEGGPDRGSFSGEKKGVPPGG